MGGKKEILNPRIPTICVCLDSQEHLLECPVILSKCKASATSAKYADRFGNLEKQRQETQVLLGQVNEDEESTTISEPACGPKNGTLFYNCSFREINHHQGIFTLHVFLHLE